MLRVGLTGGLGSGKSTVGRMLADRGAYLLEADAIGRSLMEPGQAVFHQIVERFGPTVLRPDGSLDRPELARLAFGEGRVEDLNAIVHPAVIAQQAHSIDEIAARDPGAVIVVESALIFETRHGADPNSPSSSQARERKPEGWSSRFDRIILVTAPDDLKIRRYVDRTGASGGDPSPRSAEARRRLDQQIPDAQKAPLCDFVLDNGGDLSGLEAQVERLWPELRAQAEGQR